MKVNIFFPYPRCSYSIEELFNNYIDNFPTNIDPIKLAAKFQGAKIWAVLGNLIFAFRLKGKINHITGHVHYLALVLSPKTTILTIHDLQLVKEWTGIKGALYRFFWYWLPIKRARFVTVISEETKKTLLECYHLPKEKVKVIPNCVSPCFKYIPRTFDKRCPHILHVGVKENKNLIRVAKALKGIKCHLNILGVPTNEQKTALKECSISYYCYSYLKIIQVASLYSQCDFVCFASTYEGFGMPIIEGQATGRPVLTSNLSSMPEVAGNAACFVDPYDVCSIRTGILRIINDTEYREQLVGKGFENVKRFNLDKTISSYISLYEQIALDLDT